MNKISFWVPYDLKAIKRLYFGNQSALKNFNSIKSRTMKWANLTSTIICGFMRLVWMIYSVLMSFIIFFFNVLPSDLKQSQASLTKIKNTIKHKPWFVYAWFSWPSKSLFHINRLQFLPYQYLNMVLDFNTIIQAQV